MPNTNRLYYTDSYLREFSAQVVAVSEDRTQVYLDQSAFYPTSGGQAHDLGWLGTDTVVDVIDQEQAVAHQLAAPTSLQPGQSVTGKIDWKRRFGLMQQHSGQHLLSSVLEEEFGLTTVSVALSGELCTVELAGPAPDVEKLRAAEMRANEVAQANHPIFVTFEEAAQAEGLRKASSRTGQLRIVNMGADGSVDRSACGGTHLRHTGEIGPIVLRRAEKIRENTRVEFLCGLRAIALLRTEYDTLQSAAKVFSAAPAQLPQLAAAARESAQDAQKRLQKLQGELAGYQAKEWYAAAPPGPDGLRRFLRVGPLSDEVRPLATSFCSGAQALFVQVSKEPAAILVACSTDSGLHAGNILKQHLLPHGGRGGGGATMAQGTAPTWSALRATVEALGLVFDA